MSNDAATAMYLPGHTAMNMVATCLWRRKLKLKAKHESRLSGIVLSSAQIQVLSMTISIGQRSQ